MSNAPKAFSLFLSAIQCELPRNPQNGRAVYASVSVSNSRRLRDSPNLTQSDFFQYNSLISYECNYGYMLIGDSVRRCEKDKQWTGAEPHCKGGFEWNTYIEPTRKPF